MNQNQINNLIIHLHNNYQCDNKYWNGQLAELLSDLKMQLEGMKDD